VKPRVICHMASSMDGRILPDRWRPHVAYTSRLYERLHEELGGDAWLVGRVTGQEFAKGSAYPQQADHPLARQPWIAQRGVSTYAVVLDAHGKIAWGRSDINGDPIVVVLTGQVPESHLAGLRADGVSYIFAGEQQLDLALALQVLSQEFGIQRLLLEGGGKINGAFLRAGLIDEISLLILPTVDGAKGAPSIFDSDDNEADAQVPIDSMILTSSQVLDDGAVWLRYQIRGR
jgi:riboflavin biosynthesis pyrimidine reductase